MSEQQTLLEKEEQVYRTYLSSYSGFWDSKNDRLLAFDSNKPVSIFSEPVIDPYSGAIMKNSFGQVIVIKNVFGTFKDILSGEFYRMNIAEIMPMSALTNEDH